MDITIAVGRRVARFVGQRPWGGNRLVLGGQKGGLRLEAQGASEFGSRGSGLARVEPRRALNPQ